MTQVFRYLLYGVLIVSIGSCAFGKKIKDGTTAYDRKQYAVAAEMLEEEYTKADNSRVKGNIAYLLGSSYSFLEESALSTKWFAKSVDLNHGNEALIGLAKAYKKQGNYDSAIKAYEILRNSSNDKRSIDREIFVIKEVATWTTDSNDGVTVSSVSENTGYSEYAPFVLDKNFLVFTSDRGGSTGGETYNWTGNEHSDIYVMLKNGSDVRRFDASINSDANEGAATFTKDGLEMVFTRCYTDGESDGYCKLMYSERFSGVWTEPRPLPIMKEAVNYGQPTFIENDSVLVFSAKMDDGTGGHDLYYSERVMNESGGFDWGEAYIFPQTINSAGNEMFPSGDGDTLYFSSDYFAGLGGLDIFKTWLQPNGQWAPPQNLKKPINSSYDDFSYVVDNSALLRGNEVQKGYFTSTRSGDGKDDLYKFVRKGIVPKEVDTEIPVEEQVVVDIYLAGKTKQIEYNDPNDPNSGKKGKLTLEDCYITINDGERSENIYSDEKGQFILQLVKDKDYTIKASKIGYLNTFTTVSTKNLQYKKGELSKTINIEMILNKIYSNVEINLENIYYNFNKSDIRKDAEPTLDSLSQILTQNPQINIQLSSHTDCRGDDEYNQILSQKRAESAVAYIASKGIALSRMSAKGFGENKPNVDCDCESDSCTEEQHQINRRTTFKILE